MAQQPGRPCPNCGSYLVPGQRFCSNCGTVIEAGANKPTERAPEGAPYIAGMETQPATPPPPPLPSYSQPQSPPPGYQPPPMGYQPPPAYARRQKDSTGSVLGQIGCGMLAIILLILAVCGGISYLGYTWVSNGLRSASTGSQTTTTGSNAGSNFSGDVTPTQMPVVTTSLNASVTYADIKLMLLDTKQANFFTDDRPGEKPGVLRIDFKEEASNRPGAFLYGDVTRLLLPDGTNIAPLNQQYDISAGASTTRQNWMDFAVPTTIRSEQTTLRVGRDTEAQMDIPLKSGVDVGKYQPKTVHPNKQTQYSGLTWTLTDATMQWSASSRQAEKGKIYVVMTLKIDNNSTSSFSGLPENYLRLKAGDTMSPPSGDDTIPISVDAGQTNATGSCAFLMPQGATDYTLLFLGTSNAQQTSITFQIA